MEMNLFDLWAPEHNISWFVWKRKKGHMADCSRHHVFSVDLNLQEGSAPIGTDDDQSSLRAQLERWNRFAPFTNHDFIWAGSFHCHAKCHAGIGLFHPLIMIFSSLDLFIVMQHISLSNRKQQIDDICKQGTVAMLDSWSATTLRKKRRTRRRITSLILSPRRVRTSQSELRHCKNATTWSNIPALQKSQNPHCHVLLNPMNADFFRLILIELN